MTFDCAETVSILYALLFGADGACISIDTWSLVTAFGAFIGIVVALQFIARKAWARLTVPRQAPTVDDGPETGAVKPFQDDPKYAQSAIRTSRK